MELREYFDSQSTNISKFAKKIGVSHATIFNILRGENLRLTIAMSIEKATEGKVTCQDLYKNIKLQH